MLGSIFSIEGGVVIEIKLPLKVKVAGITYEIIYDERTKMFLEEKQLYGQSSSTAQEIRIIFDVQPDRFSEIFIHELLHCVNNAYLDETLEDREVAGLASGLHQVFEELGIRFVK